MSKVKRLKTLVQAFSKFPNVKLKIAGTGEEMDALRLLATDNIEFLGFLKGSELKHNFEHFFCNNSI